MAHTACSKSSSSHRGYLLCGQPLDLRERIHMRLSGVDPGIIRELSGIYKPFVKAFKELLSNSFDADAKTITIVVKDDLTAIEVLDDGNGMTPYDFRDNFARLGGSTAWLRGGQSHGRPPRIA